MKALALVLLAGAIAACNPILAAQTLAPPGRNARLDAVEGFWTTKYYRLELTQGVAFAFNCTYRGPCEHVTVTSDDPAIAEPRPASLGKLEPNHSGPDYGVPAASWQNQANAAATVVIARAVGTTRLHLRSGDGDRLILVTVVAPPPPRVGAR